LLDDRTKRLCELADGGDFILELADAVDVRLFAANHLGAHFLGQLLPLLADLGVPARRCALLVQLDAGLGFGLGLGYFFGSFLFGSLITISRRVNRLFRRRFRLFIFALAAI